MSNPSVNFKYKFPEDFNPVYINGAYGGSTPQGELVMNFYLERQPIPYSETVELEENDLLSDRRTLTPENHNLNIIRYISSGIVMNLETAKEIQRWFHLQ